MDRLSTELMTADADGSAVDGQVRRAPFGSLWTGAMAVAALVLGPVTTTWSAVTQCLGHPPQLLGAALVFAASRLLGTLIGTAGPFGMVRLHDTRDWAQRQACHP